MGNIKFILWDMDGTLVNTTQGVMQAVKAAINDLNLPMKNDDIIKTFVGPPMQDSFFRVYGLDSKNAQIAADKFREYYSSKFLMQASLYEGILNVLNLLHSNGYKMAIATYKRHDYATVMAEKLGLMRYCDFIQGGDNFNQLKKSDIIDICIDALGCKNRRDAVLIGDSEYDAVGAANANVNFIGVTYGFGFKNSESLKRYNVDKYCESPIDILKMLKVV